MGGRLIRAMSMQQDKMFPLHLSVKRGEKKSSISIVLVSSDLFEIMTIVRGEDIDEESTVMLSIKAGRAPAARLSMEDTELDLGQHLSHVLEVSRKEARNIVASDEYAILLIPHCFDAMSNTELEELPKIRRKMGKSINWTSLPTSSYAITACGVLIRHATTENCLYAMYMPDKTERENKEKPGMFIRKRVLTFVSEQNRAGTDVINVTVYLVDDLPQKVKEIERRAKRTGIAVGNGHSIHKVAVNCDGGEMAMTISLHTQNNAWTTNGGTKQVVKCSDLNLSQVAVRTFSIYQNTTSENGITDNTVQWSLELSQDKGVETALTYTPIDMPLIIENSEGQEEDACSATQQTVTVTITQGQLERLHLAMRSLDPTVFADIASTFGFVSSLSPEHSDLLLAEIIRGCSNTSDLREFFEADPSYSSLAKVFSNNELL